MDEDRRANDWDNYWQNRSSCGGDAGNVGVGIEYDSDLHTFWKDALTSLGREVAILDVACGAGSVIRQASELGFTDLSGADISQNALDVLKTLYPNVKTFPCSASSLPFSAASYDFVGSQFGFEYAGAFDAASEIARILKPGGQFCAVSHKQGSAIDVEVAEKYRGAQAILDTGFIASAKCLFQTDMSGSTDREFDAAAADFGPRQDALLTLARQSPGLAAHLYSGTQALYEKRKNYALSDIEQWLSGMESEIQAYAGRMQSMRDAALDETDMETLIASLGSYGLVDAKADSLVSASRGDVLGWSIKARKAELGVTA